jgi:hypothetical protein
MLGDNISYFLKSDSTTGTVYEVLPTFAMMTAMSASLEEDFVRYRKFLFIRSFAMR